MCVGPLECCEPIYLVQSPGDAVRSADPRVAILSVETAELGKLSLEAITDGSIPYFLAQVPA
jgi:hypothetical protein